MKNVRQQIIETQNRIKKTQDDIKDALYGAELALKSHEFTHALRCTSRLIEYDMLINALTIELKNLNDLQEDDDSDDTGGLSF